MNVFNQVDRRDYGEGFRHKSPQREGGRRDTRREKSQSEPERGGTGNKGRNAVFAAQKLVRWGGRGVGKIFQAQEREVPRNPNGWQKESSLKRRKGRW